MGPGKAGETGPGTAEARCDANIECRIAGIKHRTMQPDRNGISFSSSPETPINGTRNLNWPEKWGQMMMWPGC